MPRFEVCVRRENNALLSSALCMRLCTLLAGMPGTPAIKAGISGVRDAKSPCHHGLALSPVSLASPSSQGFVSVVSCGSVSSPQVKEVGWDFSLLPVIVKVRGYVKGDSSGGQALFNTFLLL